MTWSRYRRKKPKEVIDGFAPIVLVIIAAGIVAFGVGVWYLAKIENKQMNSLATAPTSTVQLTAPSSTIDIFGWKTYRNEKYGFEFKYPISTKEWKTYRSDLYGFEVKYPSFVNDSIKDRDTVILGLPAPRQDMYAPHAAFQFDGDSNLDNISLQDYYKKRFSSILSSSISETTNIIKGKPALIIKTGYNTSNPLHKDPYYEKEYIIIQNGQVFITVGINDYEYIFREDGLVDNILSTLTFSDAKIIGLLQMPTCEVKNLRIEASAEGATGSMLGAIFLTNASSSACTLEGYPSEVLLLDASNNQLPVRISKYGGYDDYQVGRIWIEPREWSRISFQWWNWCSAKPEFPLSVESALPNGERIKAVVNTGIPRCDAPEGSSTLTFGPIERKE